MKTIPFTNSAEKQDLLAIMRANECRIAGKPTPPESEPTLKERLAKAPRVFKMVRRRDVAEQYGFYCVDVVLYEGHFYFCRIPTLKGEEDSYLPAEFDSVQDFLMKLKSVARPTGIEVEQLRELGFQL